MYNMFNMLMSTIWRLCRNISEFLRYSTKGEAKDKKQENSKVDFVINL